jgi:hypothetical protein
MKKKLELHGKPCKAVRAGINLIIICVPDAQTSPKGMGILK